MICSYIVDWEEWSEPTSRDVWHETQYIGWNLAIVMNGKYHDMSTWIM